MAQEPEVLLCLGCGNVGKSWALTFARAGRRVRLWDQNPKAAQAAKQWVIAEQSDATIEVMGDLPSAFPGVTYVQESIIEDPRTKEELFAEIDTLAPPEAIIASSTSAIPASLLFKAMTTRSRCLIVHPVNPPHLIPLVELSPADFTDPKTVERTRSLMTALGQAPILLEREIEGFILNRLQWALLGEAMHLVGEGYCSAEDIDLCVTHGLARRWAFMGPFEVGHLNASEGLKGYFEGLSDAMGRVRQSLQADYEPSAALHAALHDSLAARIPTSQIPKAQMAKDKRIEALAKALERLKEGL